MSTAQSVKLHVTALPGLLGWAARKLAAWRERIAARRMLAAISERDLRDAGISPHFADYEARQPFWRPLRDLR
jgi:uncharacterized protein YjiS (DUF1127 family)